MSLRVWDERVLPRLTDRSLRGPELDELRRTVCAGLTGRVLEIGFGSGLNVPWYPGAVTSVAAIEPSDLAWELSEHRRSVSDVQVVRAGLDGHLTRDVPDLLTSAAWRVEDREQHYLPGPALARPWTYVYRLVAG